MPLIDSLSSRPTDLISPVPPGAGDALKVAQHQRWQADIHDWADQGSVSARLARYLTLVAVLDDRLETVTTDGHHLFFDARFAATLTSEQRHFITAHLVWHCVRGHIVAQPHRDNLRWNLACEHEANYLVLLEGLRLPQDAVFYFSQAGQGNGPVYDWLAAHPHPQYDHHFDRHPQDPPPDHLAVNRIDPDYLPLEADPSLAALWRQQAQRTVRQGPVRAYLEKHAV